MRLWLHNCTRDYGCLIVHEIIAACLIVHEIMAKNYGLKLWLKVMAKKLWLQIMAKNYG